MTHVMYLTVLCYKMRITAASVCHILSAHLTGVSLLWKSGIVEVLPSKSGRHGYGVY